MRSVLQKDVSRQSQTNMQGWYKNVVFTCACIKNKDNPHLYTFGCGFQIDPKYRFLRSSERTSLQLPAIFSRELEAMTGHWFDSKFPKKERDKATNEVIRAAEIIQQVIQRMKTDDDDEEEGGEEEGMNEINH